MAVQWLHNYLLKLNRFSYLFQLLQFTFDFDAELTIASTSNWSTSELGTFSPLDINWYSFLPLSLIDMTSLRNKSPLDMWV